MLKVDGVKVAYIGALWNIQCSERVLGKGMERVSVTEMSKEGALSFVVTDIIGTVSLTKYRVYTGEKGREVENSWSSCTEYTLYTQVSIYG